MALTMTIFPTDDLLAVDAMKLSKSTVEAPPIGRVHRVQHAPKLMIERAYEMLGAP